jgi:agmatinase
MLQRIASFGNLPAEQTALASARAVVLPVPFERSTTGGKGTALAPQAIIDASDIIESFDEERGIEVSTVGIHTAAPLEVAGRSYREMAAAVEEATYQHLAAGRFPVLLGGEHSISAAALAACGRFLGHSPTLVQIDAHADLRESYLDDPTNHACAMRLCLPHAARLVQLGIRAICQEEWQLLRWSAAAMPPLGLSAAQTPLGHPAAMPPFPDIVTFVPGLEERVCPSIRPMQGRHWEEALAFLGEIRGPVYLSIDMDGLDPSLVPGVGTPEPGGMSWGQVTDVVRTLCRHANLVAADVVELMPIPGQVHSEVVAAKLVWRILSHRFHQKTLTPQGGAE